MANVTQQITNYLGGVSRIPDFNKQPGQVRELTNGYPDLTYGLLKRPGTEYLYNIPTSEFVVNDDYTIPLEQDACFHVIDREGDPTFLVIIAENFLSIFNLDTGEKVNVDIDPDLGYLGYYLDKDDTWKDDPSINKIPRKNQFELVSDDRRTVIVNRTMKVTKVPNTLGFEWAGTNDYNGTITPHGKKYRTAGNIGELPDSSAKEIKILEDTIGADPPVDEKLREGWHILPTLVDEELRNRDHKAGGLTVRCYISLDGKIDSTKDVSIVSAGYNYFDRESVRVAGTNQKVQVYTGLECGYVYHVTGPTGNGNNTDKSDDYYMTPFSSREDQLDTFFWVEIMQPNVGYGLFKELLPHELVYLRDENKFVYRQIDYSNRWVGSEFTNPDPSFVGNRINSAFFYNNRLGFLSEDNVILSRPIKYTEIIDPGKAQDIEVPEGNPYIKRNPREVDFFRQSSIQQNDSDPIDISAANNSISKFSKAFSTPQGIMLFADGQQTVLTSNQNGPISPNNAEFRNLSFYECDSNVKAVTMNQQYYFIDQSVKSSRLHRILPFNENAPEVEDITKAVQDWCPNNMDALDVCQAAGMIILSRRDRYHIYIYRTKGNYSSWFRWKLPEQPLHIFSSHDEIYFIMNGASNTINVARADLFLYPNTEVLEGMPDPMGFIISPYLDYHAIPSSNSVTITDNQIRITIPDDYPRLVDKQICIATAGVNLTPSLRSVSPLPAGYVRDAVIDGNELVASGNFVGFDQQIVFGYRYDFDVELPTFYYQSQQGADYTAYLTIARVKFAFALSGDFQFMLQAQGQSDWTNVEAFTAADYYLAESAPLDFERIVQIPIHQRNTNFRMRVKSDSPFPLALDSCMWEGNYSPRYYRRT